MKGLIEAITIIASLFVVTNISEMLSWAYGFNGVFEALAVGSVVVMSLIGGVIMLVVGVIMLLFILGQVKSKALP
jgi:hypothetical protein